MGTMPADGKMAQRIGRAKPTWMAHWPYLSGVIMRGGVFRVMLPATFVDGGREGVLQEAYLDAKFRGEGQRERESHTDIEANTQTQKQSSKQANKQEHRNTSTRVYRHCVSVYTCIYSVSYFCVYTDIHMDMYTHIFVSIDIYIYTWMYRRRKNSCPC